LPTTVCACCEAVQVCREYEDSGLGRRGAPLCQDDRAATSAGRTHLERDRKLCSRRDRGRLASRWSWVVSRLFPELSCAQRAVRRRRSGSGGDSRVHTLQVGDQARGEALEGLPRPQETPYARQRLCHDLASRRPPRYRTVGSVDGHEGRGSRRRLTFWIGECPVDRWIRRARRSLVLVAHHMSRVVVKVETNSRRWRVPRLAQKARLEMTARLADSGTVSAGSRTLDCSAMDGCRFSIRRIARRRASAAAPICLAVSAALGLRQGPRVGGNLRPFTSAARWTATLSTEALAAAKRILSDARDRRRKSARPAQCKPETSVTDSTGIHGDTFVRSFVFSPRM